MKIKNILIIRPDALGDLALITPAISLIKQKYPQTQIYCLVREYSKDLLANNPDVTGIVLDEIFEDQANIPKIYEFSKKIKAQNFDLSVHFYNEFAYALLAKLSGIKNRIGDGYSKPLLYPLYTLRANQNWKDFTLHEVEHNILLLEPLDIELQEYSPKMNIVPDQSVVQKIRKENNLLSSDYIVGIHLGTGRGNKAWLPERYAEIIDYLAEHLKAKIILTGSSKEAPAASTVLRLCKSKPINLVAQTSLSELIAIISTYNIYIGVDTGPLHIAAALGIPTVAIFPTKFVKPTEWGPWHTSHVIVRKAVKCSQKCLPRDCPFDDCLKEITEEDIVEAIRTLHANRGNNSLDSSKRDWLKKSINIFTNKEEILRELSLNGYNAIEIGIATDPQKLANKMIKEDINVIHWVGLSKPWALTAAKLLATPSLPIPPALIYEDQRTDYSKDSLIDLYTTRLRN